MRYFQFLLPQLIFLAAYLSAQCTARRGGHGRNRMKRQECQDGYEDYEGRNCCKCPLGFHVGVPCGQSDQTTCEECEPGTYLDHANFLDSCERCTSCDSNANLETKYHCTVKQNTICTCQKEHYCEKGPLEECKACYPCKICGDGSVIDKACTSTDNTVCKEAKGGDLRWIAIIIPIILLMIAIVILCIIKRKHTCFDKRKNDHIDDPGTEMKDEYTPLKGIDLTPHLSAIVKELGVKTIMELVRGDMSDATIEFAEADAPNNSEEKCYRLLNGWVNLKGLDDAFPCLIESLNGMGKKTSADKIKKMILGG